MEFLNCIVTAYFGDALAVAEDGSYPLENLDSIWKRVATINRDAAFELMGMPKDRANHNTLTNKCFCVYGIDENTVFAVYTHDGNWYIIRADSDEFAAQLRETGRRHLESRGIREVVSLCDNNCCVTYAKPALIEKE